MIAVSDMIVLHERDLEERFIRASGPGGQNVNKVATKVELRFDLPGSVALSEGAKARLRALAAGRLDARGFVLLVSEDTRSQLRNLELAREKLCELVRAALVVPKRRRATKPSKAAKRRRVEAKRKTGDKKRTRGDRSWE